MKKLFYLLLILNLFSCGTITGSTLGTSEDPRIRPEWDIGQQNLIAAFPHLRLKILYMQPYHFNWVTIDGPFWCGKVWANGCYSSRSNRIAWNTLTPWKIRHEAGHAILHTLKHHCKSDWEHKPCN